MILNLSIILKAFLSIVFICLSLVLFLMGYQVLNDIEFDATKTIEETVNTKLIVRDNNINPSQSLISPKNEFAETDEKKIVLTVKKNDTFSFLIKPYITNNKIKQKLINVINNQFDLRKLSVGQKIILYILNTNEENKILKIKIPLNFSTDLVIKKDSDSTYSVNKVSLPIKTNLVSHKYTISKSLFQDGQKDNVPLTILSEVIRLYSFDIDFQRDIQKDNVLEILYEVHYNEDRETFSYGKIYYVNLFLQKNNLEYFLFKTSEGFDDYFNREGKNVRKALMKTPLDGARISSNYGMRKHPILGYNKIHQGVDFAAPKGTPVFAAGNGKIEFVGRNGGYGKYIRIRHNSSYKTAYAHLNSYNKGISKGVRVNQGQIIGFVGSSGRSSGPHLHYEVIYQNTPINPMTMKLPSGKVLKTKELKKFKNSINIIYSDFLFHLFE